MKYAIAWVSWLICLPDTVTPRLPENVLTPTTMIAPSIGKQAAAFTREKGLDTTICLLIDLSVHNGRNRFFVYDLTKHQVRDGGLVTHGSCNTRYLSAVQYSNQEGSGCSAYGRYKVGMRYRGRFGLAYRLHGLDKSNSESFKRAIVLHSHSCVPDQEIYPNEICNSQGCTTVSPAFLEKLDRVLRKSTRPVLLWIIR